MRKWLEKEVIGRGTCPPLIKLVQQHKDEQGRVKWDEIADQVAIISHRDLESDDSKLLLRVANQYYLFIKNDVEGKASATLVQILPDFEDNAAYDDFMSKVRTIVLMRLLESQSGPDLIRNAFQRSAELQGVPHETVDLLMRGGSEGLIAMANNVVLSLFNAVDFYRRDLTDQDLEDIPDVRGDPRRQRILARAPYYLTQMVSFFGTKELIGNLDRPALHTRNTTYAIGIDPKQYGRAVDVYREE